MKALGWFVIRFIIYKLVSPDPSERSVLNNTEPGSEYQLRKQQPQSYSLAMTWDLFTRAPMHCFLGPRELPLANWIQPLALLWVAGRYAISLQSIQLLPTALLHFGPTHWYP